jgi:hypothetical protein
MLLIPAGYAQILHSFSLVGDPERLACTYGLKLNSAGDVSLQATLQYLHTQFHQAYSSRFNTDYALEETSARYATGETAAPQGIEVYVEKKAFTGAPAPLPQNCATLIRKRTGLAGRRRQGRMYLPAPYEGGVGPTGLIVAGDFNLLQTASNTFLAAVNSSINSEGMVILHSSGISAAPVPTPVTQLVVDPVIATQRRRLR